MAVKNDRGLVFAKFIWLYMIGFTLSMLLLSTYLNAQTYFLNSVFFQNLFILAFGMGEILLVLIGVVLSLKHGIIIIKRD